MEEAQKKTCRKRCYSSAAKARKKLRSMSGGKHRHERTVYACPFPEHAGQYHLSSYTNRANEKLIASRERLREIIQKIDNALKAARKHRRRVCISASD